MEDSVHQVYYPKTSALKIGYLAECGSCESRIASDAQTGEMAVREFENKGWRFIREKWRCPECVRHGYC